MPPTLLLDPGDDATVMQEEIFGPLLPIKSYRTLDEAIAASMRMTGSLALYPFSHDNATVEKILHHTWPAASRSTTPCLAITDLPFGGVGPSGMGAYHLRAGFDAMKSALLRCGRHDAPAATCSSRRIRRRSGCST